MTFPTQPRRRWTERKLAAPERPSAIYEYFVTGAHRHFPLDMLRHDGAWPASGDDVVQLNRTPARRARFASAATALRPWTAGSSFGWSVGAERLDHRDPMAAIVRQHGGVAPDTKPEDAS